MAKERSYDYFWNSDSDRYYDADSMGDWLRPFSETAFLTVKCKSRQTIICL